MSLTLLPVQMRAGAFEAHPHSLLQLLVDASDGYIDHHLLGGHVQHDEGSQYPRVNLCAVNPDIPSLEESGRAAGGVSVLVAASFALPVPVAGLSVTWPAPKSWRGQIPAPEPPPPRTANL